MVFAQAMVSQYFDYPTIRNRPSRAIVDHTLQLCLQNLQRGDLAFHSVQMPSSNSIYFLAWAVGLIGQLKQVSDIIKGKAQFAAVTHEGKSFQVSFII